MIPKKQFKKMIWCNILEADTRGDLAEEIKQFQYNNPGLKIIDIKYNHAMCVSDNSRGNNNDIHNKYSAMIIYK